ncbi:MAG: PD-(D/E)XK nuclease domain-containing protein, partial [Bacteroidia bacterium]|nr:PD-(D/E)XK nuclease domain-containing protein [Bacteroidia bacterium]
YCWDSNSPKVYNPYDILLYLNTKKFKSYWFETGTATFLVELIQNQNYYVPNLENCLVDDNFMNAFDIESMPVESILWQTGYLTIKEEIVRYHITKYRLGYPNFEVEYSLNQTLLKFLGQFNDYSEIQLSMLDALEVGDLLFLRQKLQSLLSGISHTNISGGNLHRYEGFYASIIYTFFKSLGLTVIAEDVTSQGRIDLTVMLSNQIYLFEFKMKSLNQNPLNQIKQKRYYEKYLSEQKPIYLVGVTFDEIQRNIVHWEHERIA